MAESCIPVNINHLCCQICSKVLRNPVTVPCGHNFCMQCIQDCWSHKERDNRPCSCPECGKMFPVRPLLIKNTTLAELVRETDRCDNGSEKRKQQGSGVATQVLKRSRSCTETGTPGIMCGRHNSPLDVYCCTDELIICTKCALDEHQGHRIGHVEFERRLKQVDLKIMQTRCKEILQKQEENRKDMEKILNSIQEEARQTEDICEGFMVTVIDSLQKHYQSVRERITAQKEAAVTQLQIALQTLEAKMEEMKKRDAELDCLAQTESDACFLRDWPSLQLLCEKDHLHPLDEVLGDPLVPLKLTKQAVEQFGNRLEEFCDKEFASFSETGLSGVNTTLTQQNVEPETRAQFLQYACELTLNPATAHKDLVVSKGDKEVKMSLQKIPGVHCPERFVQRKQVLCREGLQGERCYYEVEVEGEKVEIALAYKSINRKSNSKLSAFGGNTNSWSLDRSKAYSVSHNSGSILLQMPPSHHRIGVYLKFKEGSLSFYEVSDSMKFLYRVETKFTESLYPGFWLGEKCGIRICDLRQDRQMT